jgi:hypothetical protein
MANGRSLDFTIANCASRIQITADKLAPDKFLPDVIIDIIHEKILDVAEMLGDAGLEEYIEKQALTLVSKVADISTYRIDKVIAIRSSTAGVECLERGTKHFERDRNRSQLTSGTNSVVWSRFGKNIEFEYGSALTIGTLTMIFKALPTKKTLAAPTETIDIPDKFVPLVLEKAEAKLYELVNQAPPATLEQSIVSRTDYIRKMNQAEDEAKKGNK